MTTEQQAAIERLSAENALLQLQIAQIRRDTIEECAKVCEEHGTKPYSRQCNACASALRSLPQGAGQPACSCGKNEWRDFFTGPNRTHYICASCGFKCPVQGAGSQPASAAHVPDDADWGAIQAACDEDCPVSMIADMSHGDCNWGDMADRIVKYAEAAFARGLRKAAALPSAAPIEREAPKDAMERAHERLRLIRLNANDYETVRHFAQEGMQILEEAMRGAAPIQEREAFEASQIAHVQGYSNEQYMPHLERTGDGYRNPLVHAGWISWKARAALAAPALPEGYALVPIVPNGTQQFAGAEAVRIDTTPINKLFTATRVYSAMVKAAAAPIPATHKEANNG